MPRMSPRRNAIPDNGAPHLFKILLEHPRVRRSPNETRYSNITFLTLLFLRRLEKQTRTGMRIFSGIAGA